MQNPLTALADDVATIWRALDLQDGPVLLVGHSWGGVVVTEAGNNALVAGLVYLAGFAPSSGESLANVFSQGPVGHLAVGNSSPMRQVSCVSAAKAWMRTWVPTCWQPSGIPCLLPSTRLPPPLPVNS